MQAVIVVKDKAVLQDAVVSVTPGAIGTSIPGNYLQVAADPLVSAANGHDPAGRIHQAKAFHDGIIRMTAHGTPNQRRTAPLPALLGNGDPHFRLNLLPEFVPAPFSAAENTPAADFYVGCLILNEKRAFQNRATPNI